MKGILINKYLKKIFDNDEKITSLVKKSNIKAMILQPTNFPFISFKRNQVETHYNKDIPYEDVVSVDIICVTNNYAESVEIAQAIRESIEFKVYKDSEENILITKMWMTDADENTVSDSFVQTLTFEIHIQDLER